MKFIFLALSLVFSLTFFTLQGQDCKIYFPDEVGTEIETVSYNPKDKLTGTTRQIIEDKQVDGDNISINIAHSSFDKKGELIMDGTYQVRCEDGVFYLDMRNMLDEASLSAYENMEVEVNSNDMAFPSDMQAGQSLPDANIAVKISSGGASIMTVRVNVTNRVVEAIEMVSTPSGEYECYKISSDIESQMMIKVKAKSIQWITEDYGVIRTESYNKSGKLQGYSVMTKIIHQ